MFKSSIARLIFAVAGSLILLWLLNSRLAYVIFRPSVISKNGHQETQKQPNYPPSRESQEKIPGQPSEDDAHSDVAIVEPSRPTPTTTTDAKAHSSIVSSLDAEGSFEIQDDKMLVIGTTTDEDASWARDNLPMWQHNISLIDNRTEAASNKGRAELYLNYLIDNYDHLPTTIAFVHPHKNGDPQGSQTDGQDHSNVKALQNLNLDFVQKSGYVNLRCVSQHGCPAAIRPFRKAEYGSNQTRTTESAFGKVWTDVFNNTDIPREVGTPCCAQFAVSRAQVRKRPREHYGWFRQYLRDCEYDDATISGVYEYLWHVMFGKEAVHCPPVDRCFEEVFSRGTLSMGMGG